MVPSGDRGACQLDKTCMGLSQLGLTPAPARCCGGSRRAAAAAGGTEVRSLQQWRPCHTCATDAALPLAHKLRLSIRRMRPCPHQLGLG